MQRGLGAWRPWAWIWHARSDFRFPLFRPRSASFVGSERLLLSGAIQADDSRLGVEYNMTSDPIAVDGEQQESIPDYYNDTVDDYEVWSKEGYLHYGYWRPWLNPFRRKPMLEEMNRLVFSRLRLEEMSSGAIADLGCGVGGVSRHGSRLHPHLEFHAMTVSPGQVAAAKSKHRDERVTYYCGDYHHLPFEDRQLDGAFYLESLCHSTRPETALAEAARTLKPGARLVSTDGYLARPLQETSKVFKYVVETVAHNWAVPMFHEIDLGRQWTGNGQLKLIEEFECGWRLGPSAMHAAHLSVIHFLKLMWRREVTPWQWNHLRASAFTIALGLYRRNFRYHVLVFEKQ